MSLPRRVYVYEDKGSDGVSYLVATKDSHEQMEGMVGIYELVDELHVRHKPQFRRKGTRQWFDK